MRYRSIDDLSVRYRKLPVADLKAELRKVGLKPRGLKKDLVRQLAEKEHRRLVGDLVHINCSIMNGKSNNLQKWNWRP